MNKQRHTNNTISFNRHKTQRSKSQSSEYLANDVIRNSANWFQIRSRNTYFVSKFGFFFGRTIRSWNQTRIKCLPYFNLNSNFGRLTKWLEISKKKDYKSKWYLFISMPHGKCLCAWTQAILMNAPIFMEFVGIKSKKPLFDCRLDDTRFSGIHSLINHLFTMLKKRLRKFHIIYAHGR